MAWFKSGYKQTDTKDRTASFTQAGTRENIRSGEKHKTLFGKIAKYFSDLKPVAFTGSYNDLQDKPSNLAPAAHRHSKSDITDFPSSLPASDVYSWAKAASKPAYTADEVGALPISGGTVTGGLNINGLVQADKIMSVSHGATTIGRVQPIIEFGGSYIEFKNNNTSSANFAVRLYTSDRLSFQPVRGSTGRIGSSSYNWNEIYVTNSPVVTSDRNKKRNISYIGRDSKYKGTCMSDTQLVAFIMGLLPCIFLRTDGESERPHHGIISQDFEELMTEIGLQDHAAFIKSPVIKIKEVKTKDEDGNIEHQLVEEIIPDEYRYGIRYEELIADLIRFCQLLKDENSRQQKKIEDLEKRIKILEDIIKQGA